MNWLSYFFGSGLAFFAGAGLIVAGVAAAVRARRTWAAKLSVRAAFVGLCIAVISGTPLPLWFYVPAVALGLGWQVAERSAWTWFQRWRVPLRVGTVAAWLIGVGMELPYQFPPTLTDMQRPGLAVIGDSLSAGMGEHDRDTWPRVLARARSAAVEDRSFPGATTAAGLREVRAKPITGDLVLVEIGGNDMLGSTPAAKFERDLDELLAAVCRPGRVVLMFELPLPPSYNAYGRAQRRVAWKHGVQLIPKRCLIAHRQGQHARLDPPHARRARRDGRLGVGGNPAGLRQVTSHRCSRPW